MKMNLQYLQLSIENRVATVTLNRTEVHNAFNPVMISEVTQAFQELSANKEVRVIILTSNGKSFCAGGDLAWMQEMVNYSQDENYKDAMRLSEMFRAIQQSSKPTIARVQGAAYGGGVGLVASCDIAVAVSSVTFCFTEVKLGLIPAVIMPFVLKKTGVSPLYRYMITAEPFGAVEAKRLGLIAEIVDSIEELDTAIHKLSALLQKNGPQAMATCKKLLREVQGDSWEHLQQLTARHIADLRVSPEGQEGLKSFLEKRSPNWQNI